MFADRCHEISNHRLDQLITLHVSHFSLLIKRKHPPILLGCHVSAKLRAALTNGCDSTTIINYIRKNTHISSISFFSRGLPYISHHHRSKFFFHLSSLTRHEILSLLGKKFLLILNQPCVVLGPEEENEATVKRWKVSISTMRSESDVWRFSSGLSCAIDKNVLFSWKLLYIREWEWFWSQ